MKIINRTYELNIYTLTRLINKTIRKLTMFLRFMLYFGISPGFSQQMHTIESLPILSMVKLDGNPGMWTALLPIDWTDLALDTDNRTWLSSILLLFTKTLLSAFLRIFGLVVDFWIGINDFVTVCAGGEVDLVGWVLLGGGDGPFIRAVVCRVWGAFPDCKYECLFRF